ncbi:DUF7511 domain-containing protein [Natronosalvus hydrolyticus]|uniref:DUF7511 domain-containing protein n=1 Tax=Natronosalvus hydrolyticus TaxID=2979988 RepID=UPI003CCC7A72
MDQDTNPTTETETNSRTETNSTLYAFVHQHHSAEVCTLYPPTAIGPHRTDSWIRATGNSFQSLEDCR